MKRFLALILSLLMLLGLVACGATSQDDKFYNETDPIQIVDGAGRKVSFTELVKTIATSWGGTCDSFIFALGVQDRLVATNSTNDFHKLMIADMDSMKSVGRWALDKEALADLSPDLFIHGVGGVDQFKNANKVGVPCIALGLNTFDDVTHSITMLSKVFGVEDRAAHVNACTKEILDLVAERTANLSDDQKLTVVVLGEEAGTVGCDIYNTVEEMVVLAGGISVVPEDIAKKTELTNVGLETIFKWNADSIFLTNYFTELTVDGIMSDSNWSGLNAVKNNRVYAIPCELDSWSNATPSACLAVLYMSMELYPELYEDVDFEGIVIQFYKDVYGVEVTREIIGLK